jgi:hypothetical protein
MNSSTSINSAFCLSVADLEALSRGRMIAALSRTFVNTVQQFALCPVQEPKSSSTISIEFWAKLEFCKIYTAPEEVDKLAKLTIWSNGELQKILRERFKVFLLCLRVFQAAQPIEIAAERIGSSRIGSFIKIPNYLSASNSIPVISDESFNQRKQQLNNLESPPHPELEELEASIARLDTNDKNARDLDQYLQSFLGWTSNSFIRHSQPKFNRIHEIAALGYRSLEEEKKKKNNHKAGTDFEIIVRESLEFLGFKIEEEHKGGAGGLDLFCSSPYFLAAECKSGKSIPDKTVEQLDRIGKRHLDKDYMSAVRLIIGPGQPTKNLRTSAITSEVSIINPMTLQKLIELHAKYPVDLIELKKYLIHGQIDDEIQKYIDKVYHEVEIRSQIVKSVKELSEKDKQGSFSAAEIRVQHNSKFSPFLDSEEIVRELLIELSSPLTGFLGRRRGNDGHDRFYFLRDMPEVE